MAVMSALTEEQFTQYEREGFFLLGRTLETEELDGLRSRLREITEATVHYDGLQLQLYDTDDDPLTATRFRKIGDLCLDDRFLTYFQKPLFRQITRRYYGEHVSAQRAMLFNNYPKLENAGIAYHQDGGDSWNWIYDRHPTVTVWTALDDATVANGCVHVLPATHEKLVPLAEVEALVQERQAQPIELEAGEAVLLHNWTFHGSFPNRSDRGREAVTICYADSATRRKADDSPCGKAVFGNGALRGASPRRSRRLEDVAMPPKAS